MLCCVLAAWMLWAPMATGALPDLAAEYISDSSAPDTPESVAVEAEAGQRGESVAGAFEPGPYIRAHLSATSRYE